MLITSIQDIEEEVHIKPLSTGRREIGPGRPCFFIAEAGVNHNGDPALARELIDIAAESGADAVKFQTFNARRVISPDAPKAKYQKDTTGESGSQIDVVRNLEFPFETFGELSEHASKRGILFLSTGFDTTAVDYLESIDMPILKIASGEITNFPLLRHFGATKRPVILSTGMSDIGEVSAAIAVLEAAGSTDIAILHCTSNYPARYEDVNLRAMLTLRSAFERPVGYSDHSPGIDVALAAVALGANILEKHFTVDKSLPGPDHQASLTPSELTACVTGIRNVERSLGSTRKYCTEAEMDTRYVARRSLFLAKPKKAQEIITEDDLIPLRPGDGVPASMVDYVVGRRLTKDLPDGYKLQWSDLG